MPFRQRPKLQKTRSNDAVNQVDTLDMTLGRSRTSFSDLRSTKSSFSRTPTSPDDVKTPVDQGPASKARLLRVASASALNLESGSAAFINPESPEPRRAASALGVDGQRSPALSPSPTADKIDVEQAINLLQELKKRASPEELVSLHRALLPTKENPPMPLLTPPLPSIDENGFLAAPSGRVRSVLPPGLATRTGMNGDPLRSREEHVALTAKSKEAKEQHGSWFTETMSAVHARALSVTSTGTAPDSSDARTAGAFQLGTLRVTNGADPPESKLVAEADTGGDKKPLATEISDDHRRPAQPASVPSSPRYELDAGRRASADLAYSGPNMSLAQRRQQQRGARGFNPVLSLPSKAVPEKAKKDADSADRELLPSQRRRTMGNVADLVAQSDAPRFQQRWTHRASHLITGNSSDLSEGPHDEETRTPRGYTAYNHKNARSVKGQKDVNTCTEALQKLTGNTETDAASDHDDQPSGGNAPTETESPRESRSRWIRKPDSGYCSEASNPAMSQGGSNDAGKVTPLETTPELPGSQEHEAQKREISLSPVPLALRPASATPRTSRQIADSRPSLATVRTTITSSRTPSPGTTAFPDAQLDAKKKSFPLALFKSRNRAAKRNTLCVDTEISNRAANESVKNTLIDRNPDPISPAGSIDTLKRKTLQKRMPDAIRQHKKPSTNNRKSMSMADGSRMPASPASPKTVIKHVPKQSSRIDTSDEKDSKPSEATGSSWKRRSKSFARRRSRTFTQEDGGTIPPAPSVTPAPVPSRRRSKSLRGPGFAPSNRASTDVPYDAGCIRGAGMLAASSDLETGQGADDVARALKITAEEGGVDGSATAHMPRAVQGRRNSVRSAISRKSRESSRRFPVIPQSVNPASPCSVVSAVSNSSRSVEDIYPDWKGRPASSENSPAAQEALLAKALPVARTNNMLCESVPPLPELPVDYEFKISRAEEMLTKKLRGSPRASARNSTDVPRKRNAYAESPRRELEPSRLNISESVMSELEGDSASEPVEADSKPLARRFSFDPIVPFPEDTVEASGSEDVSAHVSELPADNLQSSDLTNWKMPSSTELDASEPAQGSATLPSDEKIPVFDDGCNESYSPGSPSIVVSDHTAPLGSQNSTMSHKRSSTAYQLDRPMVVDEEEELDSMASRLDQCRSPSIMTATTNDTTSSSPSCVGGGGSGLFPRDSSVATSPRPNSFCSTAPSISSASLASDRGCERERGRSPSQSYLPYRPADAVQAERSRALSLARRSCNAREAELLGRQPSLPQRRPSSELPSRFGRGLAAGWSREDGGAGVRAVSVDTANRKSMQMSEEWGLN